MLNLAVNGRDAMHGEGSLVIAIEERQVDGEGVLKAGRYVCLSVTDSGEGMDEVTLTRATEPFFTTKGLGKGTGLGLSMVHGLADQSGGALILKSMLGVGTTAEIWLAAIERVEGKTRTTAAPIQATAPNQRLAILVVDDDPLILMSAVHMLEDLGHSVVSAGSAKQALFLLEQTPFDLIDHGSRDAAHDRCPTPKRGPITIPCNAGPLGDRICRTCGRRSKQRGSTL